MLHDGDLARKQLPPVTTSSTLVGIQYPPGTEASEQATMKMNRRPGNRGGGKKRDTGEQPTKKREKKEEDKRMEVEEKREEKKKEERGGPGEEGGRDASLPAVAAEDLT